MEKGVRIRGAKGVRKQASGLFLVLMMEAVRNSETSV
jgi:hypothetical protein